MLSIFYINIINWIFYVSFNNKTYICTIIQDSVTNTKPGKEICNDKKKENYLEYLFDKNKTKILALLLVSYTILFAITMKKNNTLPKIFFFKKNHYKIDD